VIRILLVDDHTLLRETLAEVLDDEPDLDVVAQAGDGDEAIAMAERVRPDIVLLDVQMPGAPATTVVEQIRTRAPDAQIIVLTCTSPPHCCRSSSAWASPATCTRA
jgi:DNA-binding NarL/FixJ family response regulator